MAFNFKLPKEVRHITFLKILSVFCLLIKYQFVVANLLRTN